MVGEETTVKVTSKNAVNVINQVNLKKVPLDGTFFSICQFITYLIYFVFNHIIYMKMSATYVANDGCLHGSQMKSSLQDILSFFKA